MSETLAGPVGAPPPVRFRVPIHGPESFPNPRPRVLVAIPQNHDFVAEDFRLATQELKTWPGCALQRFCAPYVDEMRNEAARWAMEKGYEATLFIDADMVFLPDALERISAHGKPIVSGHCLKRRRPFGPTTAIESEGKLHILTIEGRGLMPVDAVGAAFLWVSIDVFRSIRPPWFEHGRLGEDYDFCEKARKAGFSIHVDLDIRVGHITQAVVWPGDDGMPVVMMK